jgi:hypothetical protein
MKIRNLAAAAAALSLVAAPAVAQTAPERSAAPTEDASELGGSSWLLAILAFAAIIAAVVIAVDGDDDPVSP